MALCLLTTPRASEMADSDSLLMDAASFSEVLSEESEWYTLGTFLGTPANELDNMRHSLRDSPILRHYIEIYNMLQSRGLSLSWERIATCLRRMGNHQLAEKIHSRDRCIQPSMQDKLSSSSNSLSEKPEPAPKVLLDDKVDVIAQEFETLREKFDVLIMNVKKAFQKSTVSVEDIRGLIEDKCGLIVLQSTDERAQLDEMFRWLKKHCSFLQNRVLVYLVDNLLDENLLIRKEVSNLEKAVENFKSFAKMSQFITLIKEKQVITGNKKMVQLKVRHHWSQLTLKQFETVVNEILSIHLMMLVKVHKGCMCVSWAIPDHIDSSKLVRELPCIDLVKIIGIIYLHVGDDVVYNFEGKGCETIEAAMLQAIELKNTRAIELLLTMGCSPEVATYNGDNAVTAIVNIRAEPRSSATASEDSAVDYVCILGHNEHVEAIVDPNYEPQCSSCAMKDTMVKQLHQSLQLSKEKVAVNEESIKKQIVAVSEVESIKPKQVDVVYSLHKDEEVKVSSKQLATTISETKRSDAEMLNQSWESKYKGGPTHVYFQSQPELATTKEDESTSLICELCNKLYQHKTGPLMLPCLHSFCKPCLTAYLKKEKDSPGSKMFCPTCYTSFPQPKDVSDLPCNIRLSNLAKSAQYKKQISSGNVWCEVCNEDQHPKPATNFCCNCSEFLCTKCMNYHTKLLNNHEFIELTNCEEKNFPPPPMKCPKHTKNELEFFCHDCKILICLFCSLTKHINHMKSTYDEVVENEKFELEEMAKGISNTLTTVDATLQQIQKMRKNVMVSSTEAFEKIDKACNDLIAAVERRREKMKAKCREVAGGKDDVLSSQMFRVHQFRNDLSFVQHHVRDAVDAHRAEEILSVKKPIQDRLHTVTEQYQQISLELMDDDVINPVFKIGPLVEEIGKTGIFSGVPDPSKCDVQVLPQSACSPGEKGVTVTLRDEGNNLVQGTAHFQYHLQKVGEDIDDHPLPKITINQSNNGTATLKFTPDKPDDVYELTVMVRNKLIADPFTVRTTPIRNYENIHNIQPTYRNVGGKCYDVAVHSDGTVYATNLSQSDVKVFRMDGTESHFGQGRLSGPFGIAIMYDTIYVVNNGSHTISMFSTDGRFLQEFGGQGYGIGNLNYPFGICIDQEDRILVADQGNKRIQFFTHLGYFVKSIQVSSQVWDVAVHPTTGNIHAALYGNRHIAVYSPQDNRLIETYNLKGNLKRPTGIHIDPAGYQFITASDEDELYIVDPVGELIVTMTTMGGTGIQLDMEGTLYVAESTNHRVAVY